MSETLLQILRSARLQFLFWVLPLFLLGISFWMGGELLTKQLLSRPYGTLDKLQADTQLQLQLKLKVDVIKTEVEKELEFTQVEVTVANSVLKKLEFELPNIPSTTQEVRLVQKLGLSSQLEKPKPNTPIIVELPVTLQVIKAEIFRSKGLTFVAVKTANDLLTKLEFEFPVTEVNMIEAVIAQELGLSRQEIGKFVRYHIK